MKLLYLLLPLIVKSLENKILFDFSTDNYCDGYTACKYSITDSSSGCCHYTTTTCCYYDSNGYGSCQLPSYCASHCSTYYSCSYELQCLNGLCASNPTIQPTSHPSVSTMPTVSMAPTISPSDTYILNHAALWGLIASGIVLIFVGTVFVHEKQFWEFLEVFFAAGDFISDIFFLLMLKQRLDSMSNENSYRFVVTSNTFIASICVLAVSVATNIFFCLICKPKLFFTLLISVPAEIKEESPSPYAEKWGCLAPYLGSSGIRRLECWNNKEICACLWGLFVLHVLIILIGRLLMFVAELLKRVTKIILFFVVNIVIFIVAITNSDLNYHCYGGDQSHFFSMTISGLLAEDVPQLIIQIVFAVLSLRYGSHVSAIQIFSFCFTAYRLVVVVLMKWRRDTAPSSVLAHAADQADKAMIGLELVSISNIARI